MVIAVFAFDNLVQAQNNEPSFYFYSRDDLETIKRSSLTEWGKLIISDFRKKVQERKSHPIAAPGQEGGYIHDYFCPEHNQEFIFDWDSPHEHYCKNCNKNWTGIKRDMAWIAVVHGKNLDYLVANMFLYIATDSVKYAQNARDILLSYAQKYPGYQEHNKGGLYVDKFSGKMFSQSLDEAVWAIDAARVYQAIKPILTDDEDNRIKNNYLKPCAELLLTKKVSGNWQAWHAGAIAALGVALENDSIIEEAINEPKYGYRSVMQENVYPDGWWKEGSAVYHFYPLEAILSTAEAVRCRGINLYDRQLLNMFAAPMEMVYSNLTLPSNNDGWYGTSLIQQAPLYEIAAKRFNNTDLKNLLALCYLHSNRSSPNALINGMELDNRPHPLTVHSTLFPDLGVAVLKNSKTSLILKYGPHGGGHGHPDKLSITMHDGQKEVLADLGTPAYGVPSYLNWYKNTFSHSTVVVDEQNQQPCTGKLLEFNANKRGGMVTAQANNAYPGIKLTRKVELKNEKISDIFLCESDEMHTYDYILIFTQPVKLGVGADSSDIVYAPMQNVCRNMYKGSIRLPLEKGELEINVNNGETNYEVFTAIAPGTPGSPFNPESALSYPLIVRVKGKNMKVDMTLGSK
ncbi:MAG: heparinase II/III family protein [Draconibacterium sp.]